MCIGQVYAFSVFNKPLSVDLGVPVSRVQWAWMIALVMLGLSAACFGKWVERSGPRKTMVVSSVLFCGGLALTALGVHLQQLWLVLAAYGVIGGVGLGLGYIAPVSTLVKWFPDRPGMATGLAIMGFGGGALIGSPLAQELMSLFARPGNTGAAEALVTIAAIYTCYMLFGAWIVKVPQPGWIPDRSMQHTALSANQPAAVGISVDDAFRTPQFWLLWIVLCMNVSAGIGILGRAADMCQDIFGVSDAVAAGFTGLLSIANLCGRFVWSSISDITGRRLVYSVYFLLGGCLYALLPFAQENQNRTLFVVLTTIIISMYGGGFATIPAYLRDLFGSLQVGAIHGRLITAWSVAAVIGPLLVNSLYDSRVAAGIPENLAYNETFHLMCGFLAVGFIANLLVRPVAPKHTSDEAEKGKNKA
jgi:MFS family permease